MATISAAAPSMPVAPVADTRPESRRAWSLAIASRVTSVCWAVRYDLQSGAAAERIAGILANRGIDVVSGRTIRRWVQKFGPALSEEIRRYRTPVSTTWLIDETYVKILGKWHDLYRGVDEDGQVLDIAGCRGPVTWLPPWRSAAARSTRPGVHPSTW